MVSKIGGAHLRAVADAVGRVAGNHRAVDHHGDALGDAKHRVHVVFDQQDGVAGFQLGQQREHAFGFFRAHAGERFVEQQHLRRGGQAHGDFKLALLAVRQQPGGAVEQLVQPGAGSGLAGGGHAGFAVLGAAPPLPRLLRRGLRGEAAVFKHREGRVNRVALVAAAQAEAGAFRLRAAGHVLAEQLDAATGRRNFARQDVDQGRFARAIGADDSVNRAALQRQRDAVQRHQAAPAAGDLGAAQQHVGRITHGEPPAMPRHARRSGAHSVAPPLAQARPPAHGAAAQHRQ